MTTLQSSTCDYMVGIAIGQGAFGTVLYGRHKVSQKPVAIKVILRHSLQKHPFLQQAILQEQLILQRCNDSPYIVSLYASFLDDECLYLVLELGTRGTLQHAIDSYLNDNSSCTSDIVTCYTSQLMQALEYLHYQQDVIHGDLKPENVLLCENGTLKLCDFGSAIDMKTTGIEYNVPRGTVDYTAPEVVVRNTRDVSPAMDLWSLGCIVVCMWTGTCPFHAASDALAIDKIMKYCDEYNREMNKVSKQIPAEHKGLVTQLIHPDATKRGDIHSIQSQYKNLLIQNEKDMPPYLPPRPDWWNEVQSETTHLRDGSQGWTAFVMD